MSSQVYEVVLGKIRQSKKALISCHINPDTDALSSVIGVCLFLEKLGIKSDVVTQGRVPWEIDLVQRKYRIPKIHQKELEISSYDLFVILDTAVLSQLGPIQSVYHAAKKISLPIINIDHHEVNPGFGTYNILDFEAAATCEVLFNLFRLDHQMFSQDLSHTLLRGIYGDTDILRTYNVTSTTMKVAAELVDMGANRMELIEQTGHLDYSRAKIWSKVLEKMQQHPDFKSVVYSIANQNIVGEEFDGETALDGVTNFMRDLKDIKLAILFIQRKEEVKISFRSKPSISSLEIAKKFGGGGHFAAAGCEFPQQNMDNVIPIVLDAIKEFILD